MKRKIGIVIILYFNLMHAASAETDLMTVFQHALMNDPTYNQIVSQTLASEEGISIDRSALLPNLSFDTRPQLDKYHYQGSITRGGLMPPANNVRSLDMKLSLKQTIFNFTQFTRLSAAKAKAKQAGAKLNAAAQDLMLRVSQAYFTVLQDEENLRCYRASKMAYEKQLIQAKQFHRAGSKTLGDVYTAQSAYGSAQQNYIMAQTKLETDIAFLKTITGYDEDSLAKLSDHIIFESPQPANQDAWVMHAKQQNWNIKANEYALEAAREAIKQTYAGNLPTLDAQVNYEVMPSKSTEGGTLITPGASKMRDGSVLLNLNVPIFSGGLTISQTNRAKYQFQAASQKLEASVRNTEYSVRQSYYAILGAIEKIKTDRSTVTASVQSLNDMRSRYKSGSVTMTDLSIQQQKVLQEEMQYVSDKYSYITNLLILKNAAGTLSTTDLEILNRWLIGRNSLSKQGDLASLAML